MSSSEDSAVGPPPAAGESSTPSGDGARFFSGEFPTSISSILFCDASLTTALSRLSFSALRLSFSIFSSRVSSRSYGVLLGSLSCTKM